MSTLLKSLTRLMISPSGAKLQEGQKIGVALGPGMPGGLVDLGMLMALKQNRIEVGMISGTSMGAVVGAMYASGLVLEEIYAGIIEIFQRGGIRKLLKGDQRMPFL